MTIAVETFHVNNGNWESLALDRCDYAFSCHRPPSVVVAMSATNTDGPATAERRPMCARHAARFSQFLSDRGYDHDVFPIR